MKKLLPLLLVILSACSHPASQKKAAGKVVIKEIKKALVDSARNSTKNHIPEFPADTIYPVRILTETVFHDDEVKNQDAGLSWVGIFKTDSSYYLAPFHINIKRVRDDIMDDKKGPKTGWEVKTGNKDTSILLIGGLQTLQPHSIASLIKPGTQIMVGKVLTLTIAGFEYKVYATGDKKNLTSPEDHIFKNYKVFIDANINGKNYHQLLVSADESEYEMSVLFASDIDGDG
ncbi:unnamed protein product, partial [Didymodactylos carnosus]